MLQQWFTQTSGASCRLCPEPRAVRVVLLRQRKREGWGGVCKLITANDATSRRAQRSQQRARGSESVSARAVWMPSGSPELPMAHLFTAGPSGSAGWRHALTHGAESPSFPVTSLIDTVKEATSPA